MKKILAFAIAALALAACAREAAPVKVDKSREVRFTTNINTFTVKADETSLEGKTVQVLAGAPLNTGSAAVVAGNSLNLTNKIYWQEGQEAKTTFVGIYPGNNQTSATIENYSITDDYGYHSTFMTATAKDVEPETTVALNFKHPFSKVVVKVTNNLTGTPEISSVALDGVILTADLDLAAETLTLGTEKVAATAAKQDNGDYAAIIMPQTVKPALVVTVGEKSYRFVLAEEFTFAANKSYTAAVTLNDSTVPVQEVEVDFSLTVTEWEDATEALAYEPETEPAPEPLPVTELYLLGDGCDASWSLDAAIPLAKEGNVFSVTANLAADKIFRFICSKDWFPSVVKDKATGKAVYCASQAEWDANSADNYDHFTVAQAGSYDIVVDILEKTVTFTRKGDVVVPPLEVSELYLLGDACDTGWSIDDMVAFTKNDNVFTLTAHLKNSGMVRFLTQKEAGKWYPALVKGEAEGKIKLANDATNDEHFTVAVSGTYLITVDIEARTYSIVLQDADPLPDWYVIGNVYDDDPTSPAWGVDFPMVQNGGILTITINVTGEFKLRSYEASTPEEDRWNTTLGMWASDNNTYIDIANTYGLATDAQGNKNIAFEEAGQYKLELNPTGNVLTATKL